MNQGKLSHDYSKCSPAIRATADMASALHRLADVFEPIAAAMVRGAEAQAVAAMATSQHLVSLGEVLRRAVDSNAGHSDALSRHLDQVRQAQAETAAAVDEANKVKDALRYAHRRIAELQERFDGQSESVSTSTVQASVVQAEDKPAKGRARRTRKPEQEQIPLEALPASPPKETPTPTETLP